MILLIFLNSEDPSCCKWYNENLKRQPTKTTCRRPVWWAFLQRETCTEEWRECHSAIWDVFTPNYWYGGSHFSVTGFLFYWYQSGWIIIILLRVHVLLRINPFGWFSWSSFSAHMEPGWNGWQQWVSTAIAIVDSYPLCDVHKRSTVWCPLSPEILFQNSFS